MTEKTDSSRLASLKLAVERKMGRSLSRRADFSLLCLDIEKSTREHLGENTLRRLWGNMQGYDTVSTQTLDVLCRYAGFRHWDDFCNHLKQQSDRESDIVRGGHSIDVKDLKEGDRIRIGWLPDRECVIEYIGERRFKAVECRNSTMQPGDTFECSLMILDHPLFADNFIHEGVKYERYEMGQDYGLTTLCLL